MAEDIGGGGGGGGVLLFLLCSCFRVLFVCGLVSLVSLPLGGMSWSVSNVIVAWPFIFNTCTVKLVLSGYSEIDKIKFLA